MSNAIFKIPEPQNEPVLSYAPGTPERREIKNQLEEMYRTDMEVPLFIGGKEVRTGTMGEIRPPHDHRHLLGRYHIGGRQEVEKAVQAARDAWPAWHSLPWHARAAIFLKAAEILTGKYRALFNAATMLGQSKTVHQSEIDSICETADFWRFNPFFMMNIMQPQPGSPAGAWNMIEHRPLEGFVFAVSPFNFTAIAANLVSAPAMMGNTVVWKPASTAMYSAHLLVRIYREAGLPDGVINMVPGSGSEISDEMVKYPDLAGVHFTGSTEVFSDIWNKVSGHLKSYRSYPRLVGETGGKDFVFAHASAGVESLAAALIRGAFEYQGQKCSAASRAYIPESLWPELSRLLIEQMREIKFGDIRDFSNFMGAVIDRKAFDRIKEYIDFAGSCPETEIISGGECDDREGYFIRPTLILTTNPHNRMMEEEIFGPVLTVFVYPDAEYRETLEICNRTSPYALTGSIFARDRLAIQEACVLLRYAAGNFYINDKPTGAAVGQQPFGGSRASGTNDKSGFTYNLLRWTSPRTIKETFCPPADFRYPFMNGE
ncbi:MAG: L-glutamate gamma-semialdehyde dehydrogenase [bacterium]